MVWKLHTYLSPCQGLSPRPKDGTLLPPSVLPDIIEGLLVYISKKRDPLIIIISIIIIV